MTRILVVCLICHGVLIAGQGTVAAPVVFEVSGRVLDADTHEPIDGAQLTLFPANGKGIVVLTDSAGSFRVADIPRGHHLYSCEREGYVTEWKDSPIVPHGKGNLVEFTMYLRKDVVIDGTVANQSGAGIRAEVAAYRLRVVDGRWQPEYAAKGLADNDGKFRLAGLEAARYVVAISTPATLNRTVYPSVFYPNATGISSARIIDLRSRREEYLDIRLATQPAYSVQGRLDVESDKIECGLTPQLESFHFMPFSQPCSWDRKNHSFTAPNVPPGTYRLEAHWMADKTFHTAARTFIVAGQNIEGIVLTEPAERKLQGTLVQDPPAVVSKAVLRLPRRASSWEEPSVQAQETFTFHHVVEGRYNLEATGLEAQCLQSIRQGGRDALRDGVLIPEEEPEALAVEFSATCGKIDVAVDAALHYPATSIIVGFMRRFDDVIVFDSLTAAGLYSTSDYPGKLVSRSLAPGNYLVFGWPNRAGAVSELPYATPEFLRQYGNLGESVTIGGDAKVSVVLHHLLPTDAFEKD